jgi:hypothetical protein
MCVCVCVWERERERVKDWKHFQGSNTLAYLSAASVTKTKSSIRLRPEVKIIKLLSSSLMTRQSKVEGATILSIMTFGIMTLSIIYNLWHLAYMTLSITTLPFCWVSLCQVSHFICRYADFSLCWVLWCQDREYVPIQPSQMCVGYGLKRLARIKHSNLFVESVSDKEKNLGKIVTYSQFYKTY